MLCHSSIFCYHHMSLSYLLNLLSCHLPPLWRWKNCGILPIILTQWSVPMAEPQRVLWPPGRSGHLILDESASQCTCYVTAWCKRTVFCFWTTSDLSFPSSTMSLATTRNQSKFLWEPKKIGRVVRDVKSSKKTTLSSFLVALLARLSPNTRSQSSQTQATIDSEIFNTEPFRLLLNEMLRDATTFCNNTKKRSARKFKENLRE